MWRGFNPVNSLVDAGDWSNGINLERICGSYIWPSWELWRLHSWISTSDQALSEGGSQTVPISSLANSLMGSRYCLEGSDEKEWNFWRLHFSCMSLQLRGLAKLMPFLFNPACLRLGGEGSSISFLQTPHFCQKFCPVSLFPGLWCWTIPFHPPPQNSAESAGLHLICPVRALRRYILYLHTTDKAYRSAICVLWSICTRPGSVQAETVEMGGQCDRASLLQHRDASSTGSSGPLYKRSGCLMGIV